MHLTRKHLSRRTLLKGAGFSVGLPLLDAMIPAATALAKTDAAPKLRAGFFYIPHGAVMWNTKHGKAMDRVPHDRAVRNIEEARPQLRRGVGLGERGSGWDHRIEQRQSDGDARAPEQGPARKMLSGQIHLQSSSACMRNASLDTIPATSDENR